MSEINKLNRVMYDKMVELYEQEKYTLAIELGKTLLDKARRMGDTASERKALEVLSFASYFLVDYINAMTYIIQYSKIIENLGDYIALIKTYFVFTSIYTRQGEYGEAKKLLDKAWRIATENEYTLELCKAENNYGFLYNTSGEYQKSIPHLERGLLICEEHHYTVVEPTLHVNLALAYLRTGRISRAKHTLDKVLLSLKSGSHGISWAEAYMYKGEVLAIEGDYEEAIKQLKASMLVSSKHGYTAELAEATKILSDIYAQMGDYESAYSTIMDYMPLKTELNEKVKEGALIKLKMQYDLSKKEIEADILRQQNAILEEQNRKIQEQTKELGRLNEVLGRQNDDLHQSAIEDYLTGVYNRKYFTLKMQEEFSIAKEQHQNVACIVFDIDRFKNINDTYGHLVGDEVIKHISSICEESLDSDSLIGRFGGDEFMILMVDSTIDDAEIKANELIENIRLEPLIIDKKPIPVTLSLGVSDNHFGQPTTTDEMINIADKGLYLAKELGRNRCCRMQINE